MGCCVGDGLDRESARAACRDTIFEAVDRSQQDDVFGVLVDALPTLGKSRTVAKMARELSESSGDEELKITVLTHRKETRRQIEEWASESGLEPHQLPRFDDDCPTAEGEYGDDWQQRVRDLRARGISPAQLHANPAYDLPCHDGEKCSYVEDWEDCREREILIGHPTHAYIDEVVENRIVVFDEDPGEAFREEFDGRAIHQVLQEYLKSTEEVIWETDEGERRVQSLDQLKSYRMFASEEDVEETISNMRSETVFGDPGLVEHVSGHGSARALAITILEKTREDLGNETERIELPENAVAVYDKGRGEIYVRRPPDLSSAAGVIGIDGTPVRRIWEGRLGATSKQKVEYRRVLCDECRTAYLSDVLGYRIFQTSEHIKPYSRRRNIHTEKDVALIEAIHSETGREPAVISTKTGVSALADKWDSVQDSGHYGAIRGSNRFKGQQIEVGIVIGSQHPGDHEVKRLAGLNGDSIEIPEEPMDRGKKLSYGVPSGPNEPENPYLSHFREHQVVQAVFRFGRHDGATVYVHTGAVPDWLLTEGPVSTEREVIEGVRSDGERQVIDALEEGGRLTASELIDRVEIAERTVYSKLENLEEYSIVQRRDQKQPYHWELRDGGREPDSVHLVDDQWYVSLPNESTVDAE